VNILSIECTKVLIVSASVGSGHDQAAKAVAAGIGRQCYRAKVEIVDFMGIENSYFNTLLKDAYLKVIDISPNLYDLLYRWSQNHQRYFKVQNMVARAMKRAMYQLCKEHQPDIVVCTHPFPLGAAAYLRKIRKLDAPLVAVMTDFSVHPLWVYSDVNYYFTATEEMAKELVKQGIQPQKIHSTGIPIDQRFSVGLDRDRMLSDLGLDPGKSTVLFMGGGLGLGPVEKAVITINASKMPIQLIVVAGKNAILRRQLELTEKLSGQPMMVVGYTNRIRALMAASDLLITKPGALTLSEAMAAKLPMVLYKPIPGQEEDNALYAVGLGVAVQAEGAADLTSLIGELINQPARLEAMKRKAERFSRPAAADSIAGIIGDVIVSCCGISAGG